MNNIKTYKMKSFMVLLYLEVYIMGKSFLYVLFTILFVFLNSCDNFSRDDSRTNEDDSKTNEKNEETLEYDLNSFNMEKTAWETLNIKNYQFVYSYFSDAGPIGPVKVTIRKDPVIENSNQYNQDIIAENIPEIYDFVNGTLDFIETVKNGTYDGHKIRSVALNIIYNTQYHYPEEVDLSTEYVEMVDGGAYYTLKITEFKIINN
jgi:hypothetical protein